MDNPIKEKIRQFKKEMFAGVAEKILLLPWIPFCFSLVIVFLLVSIGQVIFKGLVLPDQVVTNQTRLLEMVISLASGLVVGAIVKIVVHQKIKSKLKQKGLL